MTNMNRRDDSMVTDEKEKETAKTAVDGEQRETPAEDDEEDEEDEEEEKRLSTRATSSSSGSSSVGNHEPRPHSPAEVTIASYQN